MPPKTRKADVGTADAVAAPDRTLFLRRFVLPAYAADTDCASAVLTEALQAGHRPVSEPFIESTDDLAGDRKVVVWAVAV